MVKNRCEISLEQSNVLNAEREENYFGDSSSICSEEASNYPGEQELVSNFKTTLERRRRHASKKYQVARKHKLSKKKRRSKLDKKMRILQKLIPNSTNNVDNACVLDEAIVYIKTLQNQLQFVLSANAFTVGMYNSMMQTRQQPNMMHQLYSSSLMQNDIFSRLPSLVGSKVEQPQAGMFKEPSSLIMPNSYVPFSPYGSLMPL